MLPTIRTLVVRFFICLAAFWLGGSTVLADDLQRYESTEPHMGTRFRIVLYAKSNEQARAAFQAAFARVAKLNSILSDYDSESELSRLSTTAPHDDPVEVSDDLWAVLHRAQQVSRASDGAFDVTIAALTTLWRAARKKKQLPQEDKLMAARAAVSYRFVELDEEQQTVRLTRGGMRLDLGGIAKGYAADEVIALLKRRGIGRVLIDAGGDLALSGPPPGKPGWTISVLPVEPGGKGTKLLTLKHCGVATSGDRWQFVDIDGRRFSHIVDPQTGLGLTRRSSITVIAPTGMTADALASALSVLPPKQGVKLADDTEGVAALIAVKTDGSLAKHPSARWKRLAK